jgi:hypothetical protein
VAVQPLVENPRLFVFVHYFISFEHTSGDERWLSYNKLPGLPKNRYQEQEAKRSMKDERKEALV